MFEVFEVRDYFGIKMIIDDNVAKPNKDCREKENVYLIKKTTENKSKFYLVSENYSFFNFPFDKFKNYSHNIMLSGNESEYVSFIFPDTGHYLTSINGDFYICERRDVKKWELFTLVPYSNHEFNEKLKVFIDGIDEFEKFSSKLNIINNKKLFISGLFANIRSIEIDQLEKICDFISHNKDLIDVIRSYENSLWSNVALIDLVNWLNDRDGYNKTKDVVGPDYDFLGDDIVPPDGRGITPCSPTEVIVRTIRAITKPRHKFCVVATARNEGIYLPEWIAYHTAVGFEKSFIYINDCVDNSYNILKAIEKDGIVDVYETVSHDKVNVQGKAYAHCLSFVPEILDYKWVLILDIDEFFVYDKNIFSSLEDYFSFIDKKQSDSVMFDWINMGSNQQIAWDKRPCFERFSSDGFHEDEKIKSAFKPARAAKSYPHFPIEFENYSFVRRSSTGLLAKTRAHEELHGTFGKHGNDLCDNRFAVIYHYYFKSAEEFLWKSSRNRGDHPKETEAFDVSFTSTLSKFFLENFTNETKSTENRKEFPRISSFSKEYYETYQYITSIEGVEHEISINDRLFSEKVHSLYIKILAKKEEYTEGQKDFISLLEEFYKNRTDHNPQQADLSV